MAFQRKLLAASYIRMSSPEQADSPEQQRAAIRKLAEDKGYVITTEYSDLGISGDATPKRKGFQRMIADGSTRKFDAILAWDQERFGRFDLIEAGRWIEPLRNAGVVLITCTSGLIDWTSLTGQLSYFANQMGKAQYLHDLARNVKRGQDRVEQAGQWVRGFPPYGYRVDPKTRKLVFGPRAEVKLIREIFSRYASGQTQGDICTWLTAKGALTRQGKPWQRVSVQHVLSNPLYRGAMVYGRSTQSKYLPHGTPDGKRKSIAKDDWRVVYGTHEPLVSQEEFDICQQRARENKKLTGPKGKHRYAFAGMLRCGHCGSAMAGMTVRDDARRYICCGYTAIRAGCERRSVKESDLLKIVLRHIREDFIEKHFTKDDRELVRQQMREILSASESDYIETRAVAESRLIELDTELEQAVSALLATSEDLRPLVEQRVRKIQDERDVVADSVKRDSAPAADQIARAESRIDAAVKWLDRIEAVADTDFDPVAMREMLHQFIEFIEVDVERLPQGKTGTRTLHRIVGGRIHIRAEAFPSWAISSCVDLKQPSERLIQIIATGDHIVIEFKRAA